MINIQKEIIKPIPGFDGYFASNIGKVYSNKSGELKKLSLSHGATSKYLAVYLMKNHKRKYCLVHRLVAVTFIQNPDNLPEVDHIDKNILNNNVENLRWCTRKQNLNQSYSTMSPTRNYRTAKLYKNDEFIGEFKGIAKAARYAKQKFGISESSLIKYLKCGEYEIKAETNGKYQYENKKQIRKYNIGKKKVYKNGYFQKEFKTYKEVAEFLSNELNEDYKEKRAQSLTERQANYKGYTIKVVK